jgi:hypothetical protein
MRQRRTSIDSRGRRSGLAPLELVLSIPLLMMILCLIIIAGTAAVWKVRTAVNSREAAFRTVGRDIDRLVPGHWPGSMAIDRVRQVDLVFDPFLGHQVVRGPVVGQLVVDVELLNMISGTHVGSAEIDRDLPVWRRLPYRNHYVRDTPIFSGPTWQHRSMGIGNDDSRVRRLYPNFSPSP